MSIKGSPSQKSNLKQLDGFTEDQSQVKTKFITAQTTSSDRVALDTISSGLFRIHTLPKTATATTENPKRVLTCVAHGAMPGDFLRFEEDATNIGFESGILSVPDANTIILTNETPVDIQTGDEFYILRHVTSRLDDSGAMIATLTPAPIQFVLDGVDTEAMQDTVAPANSTPLPTRVLNANGTVADIALESTQQLVKDSLAFIEAIDFATEASLVAMSGIVATEATLASLEGKDFATETTLTSLNGKDFATQATLAALAAEDFATEASLAAMSAKLPAALGAQTSAASLSVVLASNQAAIPVAGLTRANAPIRNDYTSVNVTTGAYVQLVASTTSATKEIEIFDSSGQTLALAVGGTGSEVDQIHIFPGGNGRVPLVIPAASRVSIRAVSANATVGEILVNFYG